MKENLAGLATEMVNPETQNIDRCSTLEMVELVNRQDALVAGAVAAQKAEIAQAVEEESEAIAQVTEGIDQISAVVQNASATSEKSAATSRELSDQSLLMNNLVRKFRLK